MDELALLFKALQEKDLVEKLRICKWGKKSKQGLKAVFFVAAGGLKHSEPVAIWKSKSQKSFEEHSGQN